MSRKVRRFTGQRVESPARVALMANDALGNFAICTLLAQCLRNQYPDCELDFFGGERTAELEEASVGSLFDWRTSLHGRSLADAFDEARRRGKYDLVFNIEAGNANKALAAAIGVDAEVCGPCLAPDSRGDWQFPADERGDLWRDKNWATEDLAKRYSFLETGFIGEVFARLGYLDPIAAAPWAGGLPRYQFPSSTPAIETPQVLIATGATLQNKLWPMSNWREVLTLISEGGLKVGLLGAPRASQDRFYHSGDDEQALVDEGLVTDLRGRLPLPEVIGAIEASRLVLTIDNGILHFAAAFDKPTVGLYRRSVFRLWAPPNPNLISVVAPGDDVRDISVDQVWTALEQTLVQ